MIKYYFIGNETSGPELIKALEEKGGINFYNHSGDRDSLIYYCDPVNNHIMSSDSNDRLAKFIMANYEEVKLPLFQRGDRVLVKDFNSDTWKEAIYSFTEKVNAQNFYYVLGGCGFYQCIPFDINKLGKVTDE
jgi:hypothetical protein